MPGIHLNDTERKLKQQWDNNGMQKGSLLGISIHGQPGLRGITDLSIDFKYPVTVLCGKNGVGKTTILSLATLGFHRFPNFHPKDAKIQLKSYEKGSYYTFNNFFYKGPKDTDCIGVEISWEYKDIPKTTITKRSEKWMHYERRPSRAVQYLGASRIISAIEQKVLRSHFKADQKNSKVQSLNADFIAYLSRILSKKYHSADDLSNNGYHLRTCQNNAIYSSFNMGAGEDAIIELLTYIQAMPDNSLCVIEEIELGIHPEALSRLADVIQEIAYKKKMQFIISSHSKSFIDNLPRCARILLQRFENNCQVIYEPTTRFAIGAMSSVTEPELRIYCEDCLAKKIILASLSNNTRRRVEVIEVGSKGELKKMYDYHQLSTPQMRHLLVWDGDVENAEVATWIKTTDSVNYCFLHPKETPEYNILTHILKNGVQKLVEMLGFDSCEEVRDFLNNLLDSDDLHDFSFLAAEKTNLKENEIVEIFLTCYKEIASSELKGLADAIEECLSLANGSNLNNHNR